MAWTQISRWTPTPGWCPAWRPSSRPRWPACGCRKGTGAAGGARGAGGVGEGGAGEDRGRRGGSTAEGVLCVTGDGFLLTNAHVVGRGQGGTAQFSDGTSAPFTVVGSDTLSDLAVVRAAGPTPPPAELR